MDTTVFTEGSKQYFCKEKDEKAIKEFHVTVKIPQSKPVALSCVKGLKPRRFVAKIELKP